MIESYTAASRKVLAQGQYEASRFGSASVEIEHVVLGLFRSDLSLAGQLLKSSQRIHEVCQRLEHDIPRKKVAFSTSGELPLSAHCKRVLALAALAAERLGKKSVGTHHILLGVLQDNSSIAAKILVESSITVQQLEERVEPETATTNDRPISGGLLDLVAEARQGRVAALVGRQRELEQVIQILSRRTRSNAVLVGEPGVGKKALVCGLAQRIVDGEVPRGLMDRSIFEVSAADLLATLGQVTIRSGSAMLQHALAELRQNGGGILFVRGLFDFRDASTSLLAGYIKSSGLQFIATATPVSMRLAVDRHDELAQMFEPVGLLAPTTEEAVAILAAVKAQFEQFHSVLILDEAIEIAVKAAGRFFRDRTLPDGAMDLIDESAAMVKLRGEALPADLVALRLKASELKQQREQVLKAKEFAQADQLLEEWKTLQGQIERLRKEFWALPKNLEVSGKDVVAVVAKRMALSVPAVVAALDAPQGLPQARALQAELATRIPVGRRDWVEGLAAYLNDCSLEDAEELAAAIRRAKGKMGRAAQA